MNREPEGKRSGIPHLAKNERDMGHPSFARESTYQVEFVGEFSRRLCPYDKSGGFETRFFAALPGVPCTLSISSSRKLLTHSRISCWEEKAGSAPAYFSNGFLLLGGICSIR